MQKLYASDKSKDYGNEVLFPTFCESGLRKIRIRGYFTDRVKQSFKYFKFIMRLQASNGTFEKESLLTTVMEFNIERDWSLSHGVRDYKLQYGGMGFRQNRPQGENRLSSNGLLDLAQEAEFTMDLVVYPTYFLLESSTLFKNQFWLIHGKGKQKEDIDTLIDNLYLRGDNLRITSAEMAVGGRLNDAMSAPYIFPSFVQRRSFDLRLDQINSGQIVNIFRSVPRSSSPNSKEGWELSIHGRIGSNR